MDKNDSVDRDSDYMMMHVSEVGEEGGKTASSSISSITDKTVVITGKLYVDPNTPLTRNQVNEICIARGIYITY